MKECYDLLTVPLRVLILCSISILSTTFLSSNMTVMEFCNCSYPWQTFAVGITGRGPTQQTVKSCDRGRQFKNEAPMIIRAKTYGRLQAPSPSRLFRGCLS